MKRELWKHAAGPHELLAVERADEDIERLMVQVRALRKHRQLIVDRCRHRGWERRRNESD